MHKVLQVVSCLALGGTEAFIMNHYRNIDREETQFDFVVFVEDKWPYIDEIKKMGGKIFFTGVPSFKNRRNFYQVLKKIVGENGPYDAIHCHIGVMNAWVLHCAKKLDIPIRVSHSHDTSTKDVKGFVKTLYRGYQTQLIRRSATHFFACSELAGDYLYGDKFFAQKGKVLSNGIDTGKFARVSSADVANLKNELAITDSNALVIGNVTRFDDNKNPLFALEVFREILQRIPSAVLVLGGPDVGMLEHVQERIQSYRIESHVRLIGPRHDVPVCLKLLDAYLFPSKFEGLPIALLEAQAAGCICFVSDSVSRESDMGLGTVSYDSLDDPAASWAEKICRRMQSATRPSEEGIHRHFEENGYDINMSTKRLLEVYHGKA